MSILGPDGRPVSVLATEKPGRCVLCVAAERRPTFDRENSPEGGFDRLDGYERGVVQGYLVGVQLMGSVLAGSGLPADKAVLVQTVASAFCDDHRAAAASQDLSETWRSAVETAVENIRGSSVFVVGRDASGRVVGGT